MNRIENIYHNEIDDYIKSDKYIFLDVRSADEYRRGHIKGAINIEVKYLERNLNRLTKDKIYIVYCYTGGRSIRASRILNKYGFMVKNVMGGIKKYSGSSLT